MNVVSFMTTKLVDDFASHLRLYRLAQTQMQQLKAEGIIIIYKFDFVVNHIILLQIQMPICYQYFLI